MLNLLQEMRKYRERAQTSHVPRTAAHRREESPRPPRRPPTSGPTAYRRRPSASSTRPTNRPNGADSLSHLLSVPGDEPDPAPRTGVDADGDAGVEGEIGLDGVDHVGSLVVVVGVPVAGDAATPRSDRASPSVCISMSRSLVIRMVFLIRSAGSVS